MNAIVIYYSRGGTTKKMAQIITDELQNEAISAKIVFAEDVTPKELLAYDCILIGSPTYYGMMSAEIKKLLDDSVTYHGKFDGKIGGAFSSSANIGGGNESTVLSIIEAMLIHGMIIQGDPRGDHYGPVAVKSIDARCQENCKRFAKRCAQLLKNLKK